jgi:hypothetical protein
MSAKDTHHQLAGAGCGVDRGIIHHSEGHALLEKAPNLVAQTYLPSKVTGRIPIR